MCAGDSTSRTLSGTIFFVVVATILVVIFAILSPDDLYVLVWLLILFGACSTFWCMTSRARVEDLSQA
jgi:inner membrane protein involved in colicin E2 resistance